MKVIQYLLEEKLEIEKKKKNPVSRENVYSFWASFFSIHLNCTAVGATTQICIHFYILYYIINISLW